MSNDVGSSRRGRPRLDSSARRGERVAVMFTTNELAALRRLAAETDKSVSSLCHDRITEMLEASSPTARKMPPTGPEGNE